MGPGCLLLGGKWVLGAAFLPTHSSTSALLQVGNGQGEGFNVNIPWSKWGMGDLEYEVRHGRSGGVTRSSLSGAESGVEGRAEGGRRVG